MDVQKYPVTMSEVGKGNVIYLSSKSLGNVIDGHHSANGVELICIESYS